MPNQAQELIRRLHRYYTKEELKNKWVMIMITVGTEELCDKCDEPNIANLRKALLDLKHAIPRAFVVLIGPIHVARSSLLNYNLLKPRCECLAKLSNQELRKIQNKWSEDLLKLEVEFSSRKYSTFPVLTLPKLTIESRNPEQLFIAKRPLLNRLVVLKNV
jgi:Iap family predicted aminopeptidase